MFNILNIKLHAKFMYLDNKENNLKYEDFFIVH